MSPHRLCLPILAFGLCFPALVGGRQQTPVPSAITPVVDDAPTNAHDFDWMARHNRVLDRLHKGKVDLILVGDSITHGWGGEPTDPEKTGGPHDLWEKYFQPRNTVNLGFGWDRTEHLLWRLQNGEIDGIRPKVAVVMIGTNNLWKDPVDDIVAGVTQVVRTLKQKLRRTKILLLAIFPRDHDVNTVNRQRLAAVNAKIADLGKERGVTYLDINDKFLEADGTLSPTVMPDYLHPNHHGYEIWIDAMEPTLERLMGEKK